MRLIENIFFVFIQIILIIYIILMDVGILKRFKESKFLGLLQFLLVNGFAFLTLYESYLGVSGGIGKADLSDSVNQIIVAIMLVSALGYGLFGARSVGVQLVECEKENIATTWFANVFVIIVLLAITFSVEWKLTWIF